jgi:RNA-dependent RNA polymerase
MDIGFKFAPYGCSQRDLTRTFAKILHSDNFAPRTEDINFRVKLNKNPFDGTGTLTVPSEKIGHKLLKYLHDNPLKIDKKKLKFFKKGVPHLGVALTLDKTPYVNPDLEEKREKKLRALDTKFRVDIVQFGIFYRPKYPSKDGELLPQREFSIEWEGNYAKDSTAWLTFEYDHKLIRITVSLDPQFIDLLMLFL